MNIILLGAGNVATSLAPALLRAGHHIPQIYSRTLLSATALADALRPLVAKKQVEQPAVTNSLDALLPADCYLYTVTDNAMPPLLQTLAAQPTEQYANALHLHTAGSVKMDVYPAKWVQTGILYPFATFSKQITQDFSNVPLLIEANNATTLQRVRQLAEQLSPMVYEANSEQRGYVHLAGTLTNNFWNCLAVLAAEQLQKANLPFEVLLPILHQTVDKLHHLDPKTAQTGAAKRGDTATIKKHLSLLENESDRQLYQLLTKRIQTSA